MLSHVLSHNRLLESGRGDGPLLLSALRASSELPKSLNSLWGQLDTEAMKQQWNSKEDLEAASFFGTQCPPPTNFTPLAFTRTKIGQ